ncbi:tetratricopeptide repeat protein [Nitratireductor luteus]|uniref:tetratricopeptide repeat protein n=1 Tax=Nitratireductor luteus TaxID=2976980 RepID=UPI0022406A6E|nr:tetratricopeptide repeat protein [Nitratireductor luteus]
MRHFVCFILLLPALMWPLSASSDEAAADAAVETSAVGGTIDQLFDDLKRETNEVAAQRIARRIEREWTMEGGDTAELLLQWAQKAAGDEKFHVALDLLDQAVTLYPDYVEGWNSRALVHLMMDDYDRAMSDLSRALSVEPRHFGAMSGLAGILRRTGYEDEALKVYRRMLDVYPMKRAAQRALISIMDARTGDRL